VAKLYIDICRYLVSTPFTRVSRQAHTRPIMPAKRTADDAGYTNPYRSYQGNGEGGSSNNDRQPPQPHHVDTHPLVGEENFDIIEWHTAYQSCMKYFLDHAQYEPAAQAVAALLNILLPHQWSAHPVRAFNDAPQDIATASARFGEYRPAVAPSTSNQDAIPSPPKPRGPNFVSLVPYIRRCVITGFDTDAVFHGFFGDDWQKGVGRLQACERRNYLFAAKSGGFKMVKYQYDMDARQTVPWMQTPQNVQESEIQNAERTWSSWLALEDWMIGPRAPGEEEGGEPSSGYPGGREMFD